jgi:hypothetical protein
VTLIEARKAVMGLIPPAAAPARARRIRVPQPGWAVSDEAPVPTMRSSNPAGGAGAAV